MQRIWRQLIRRGVLGLAVILVFGISPLAADGSAFIGMQVQEVSDGMAQALGMDRAHGVLIQDVALGGPAAAAGLRRGDLIFEMASKPVETFEGLMAIARSLKAGVSVPVKVMRQANPVEVTLVTGTWPAAWRIERGGFANIPEVGLTVAAITEKVRNTFDLRWGSVGVVVSMVDAGKAAARSSLRRGEVIRQVDQSDVWQPGQVVDAYRKAKAEGRDALLLLVERADGFRFTMLSIK